MTRFEAVVGPVDRLRGLPLPDQLTLNAIILDRPPGADGVRFAPSDIISQRSATIEFKVERDQLLSVAKIDIPLRSGSWPCAYMVLLEEDEPFAVGAVLTAGGSAITGRLEATKNRISIAPHRRS